MNTGIRAGGSPAELLYRRLNSLRPLKTDDVRPLAGLGEDGRNHIAGAEIAAQVGATERRLVTAGVLGEARLLSDGRRQIVTLRLPGDVVSMEIISPTYAVVALTPATTVDATRLLAAVTGPAAPPNLRAAWEDAERAEYRAMLDHVVRLGRLSAYERTGHLLLELHERLLRVDLATATGFSLPITQEALADVLGLSIVHINRTLQQLRRDGLLTYRSGQIGLPDRARLATACGYVLQIRDLPPARTRPALT